MNINLPIPKKLLWLYLFLLCSSYSHAQEIVLKINVITPAEQPSELIYTKSDFFNSGNYDTVYVQLNGSFTLKLPPSEAGIYMIGVREWGSHKFMLSPGDNMQVDMVLNSGSNRLENFTGQGAAKNNFLIDYYAAAGPRRKFDELTVSLNINEFQAEALRALNKKQERIAAFKKQNPAVEQQFFAFVDNESRYEYGLNLLRYITMHEFLAGKENPKPIDPDTAYFDFLNVVPLQNESAVNLYEYKRFLEAYFQQVIFRPMRLDLKNGTYSKDKPYRESAFVKVRNTMNGKSRDFAVVLLIESILNGGKTKTKLDEAHKYLEDFKDYYSDKRYLAYITKKYEEAIKLAPGTPAPPLNLPDETGKVVSTADYKGKILVLDFWGTWCGACIRQFPDLKRIEDKYKENVVFVHVALENKRHNEWLAALQEYSLTGVNLYAEGGLNSEAIKPFQMNGTPNYMLVSADGTLVGASLPLPILDNEIKKLLKANQPNTVTPAQSKSSQK